MVPAKELLSLLTAYASVANAAAVPATAASPDHKVLVFEGPFPINSTVKDGSSSAGSVLSKRVACRWSGSPWYTPDVTELARQLQNDNPDQLSYLPQGGYVAWTWGSTKVGGRMGSD
ncbi:MAG: hypothetical protein Q9226_000738 [Calogaya cf. arnoldii]